MRNRVFSVVIFVLLLANLLSLAFSIQAVNAAGTIYIRADGSIDPPSAPVSTFDNFTYTFTGNINDSIVLERDDILIDGAGYTVEGQGILHKGIDLTSRSNVTIKNVGINNITDNGYGIYLYSSFNNSISGNNITDSFEGIYLEGSSDNVISGNNLTNAGIDLSYSTGNNSISGNNITNCGIWLFYSSDNSIVDNTLIMRGLVIQGSYGNVVRNNFVNGKPLVYLDGISGVKIEDAGQVILVNCDSVRIADLNLSNTGAGIQLRNTTNTEIFGNSVTDSDLEGIWLTESSSNNSISGNRIANSGSEGVYLLSSNNNTISGNDITNNGAGIYLWGSSNISISGNNVTNNSNYGIILYSSYNSNIFANKIANTEYSRGIDITYSSNNIISGNWVTNNTHGGIRLYSASNNSIYHNNFVENGEHVSSDVTSMNTWDDGYPSGGNYWSDYNGTDANHDGIGDTAYTIDANNTDHYPLMTSYIIPEFPSFLIPPIFFTATLLAVIICRRKHR